MKKTYSMIALLVLIGSLAAAAQAQTSNHNVARASIPFEFNIGDKTMPAGEYTVRQIDPSSEPGVLRITADKGGAVMLLKTQMTAGAAARNSSVLLFNRYGSQYFFSGMSIEGLTNAWQVTKSRTERGIARELAVLNSKAEEVAVATR